MCRGVWISESRVTRVTASVHTFTRVRYARTYTCACAHVRMRKAVDVCVKIDYTTGENVINSSTNKGLRRLYNANSKNRVGLRGLQREEDVWIVERGVGDDRVARRSRNNTDACGYFKFAWHHRVQAALAHTLRIPFDFAPSGSSLRASSEPTRPRFNLHTTDHVFRLAFTSSSPYLTTIDQAPIVFASTHPHFTTQIGRLRAGGCSLVTTPYTYVSYARTLTLCGSAAVENLANERFSFYRWHCSNVENLPTSATLCCRL